jgi:hypothetical protein
LKKSEAIKLCVFYFVFMADICTTFCVLKSTVMRIKHIINRSLAIVSANQKWFAGVFILLGFLSVLHQSQWSVEVKIAAPTRSKEKVHNNPLKSAYTQPAIATLLPDAELAKHQPKLPFDSSQVAEFVKRFAKVAKTEQEKFGLPASVSLAISLLRSQAGTNGFVNSSNNLFGLEADAQWPGAHIDQGERRLRKYNSAWASWRDYSLTWQQQAPTLPITPTQAIALLERQDMLSKKESKLIRFVIQLYQLEEIDKLKL